MNLRLFVSNLAFDQNPRGLQEYLRDLFDLGAGAARDVKVVTDRETGSCRGFAFIEMREERWAQVAMRLFDGLSLDGRPLRVREAEERTRG